jgi:adenylyltransferase/sulfurtransferase
MILGLGDPLIGRLLLVDTLSMGFRNFRVDRDPSCPACGTREIDELIDYDAFCAASSDWDEPDVGEITPKELAALLESGEQITVIDVREPYEWQIGRIPTATLIPLRTLMTTRPNLPRDADIVLYCHHGARSDAAANALVAGGYTRVRNLVGGIDRWSIEVDPSVRRY